MFVNNLGLNIFCKSKKSGFNFSTGKEAEYMGERCNAGYYLGEDGTGQLPQGEDAEEHCPSTDQYST